MFSVISRKLQAKKYIHTPGELVEFLSKSVWIDDPNVHVKRVRNVYDFVGVYEGARASNVVVRGLG